MTELSGNGRDTIRERTTIGFMNLRRKLEDTLLPAIKGDLKKKIGSMEFRIKFVDESPPYLSVELMGNYEETRGSMREIAHERCLRLFRQNGVSEEGWSTYRLQPRYARLLG